MSIVEILIVSLALSMDAFAVTISNLLAYPNLSRVRRLAMPFTFGVFQGGMLLIGFLAGYLAIGFIEAYAGPVALVILFVIGGRMIFEAVRDMRKKKSEAKDKKEEKSEEEEPVLSEDSEEAAPDLIAEDSDASEPAEVSEASEETADCDKTSLSFAGLTGEPKTTSVESVMDSPVKPANDSGLEFSHSLTAPDLTAEASDEADVAIEQDASDVSEETAPDLSDEASEEAGVAMALKTSDEASITLKAEASTQPDDSAKEKPDALSFLAVIAQGVATSLDALIVGVSLAALAANIYIAAPTVGVTTFLVCLLGLAIGKRLGVLLGGGAQLIGGVILILIGIRICFF